ncbi:MAG: zinc-ribbon and DUF3426 domain-containing protein [Steroidobacteraceae bacterium]|jgi:predicted Zn finger-like uncharacterized protein|nr:zinc-ribbon and DUF3426 domain-containing protein [Steroidobacteraceae bacterium]
MYSQCPDCLTRFRVPAAALRAAHGTVRCGQCGSAFDALPRLSDTLQVDGPASALGEPGPSGATSAGALEGATAVGLLSAGAGSSGPEFHFSVDDIEQVFVDVRDWQSRFGAPSSPGDRAGLLGDTSSAELVGFLRAGETGEEDESEHDANDPPVWVHEPESVEDITLEGERIQIERGEGFNGLEEDFLEREIEREIEEQHLAEITGSHRSLSGSEAAVMPEVAAVDSIELPNEDGVNPTQAVKAESVNPEPAVVESAEPISSLEMMPAAVAAPAARWRRPPEAEPDDSFDIGDDHRGLVDELAAAANDSSARWAWGVGALVLALLLAVQLMHHNRLQLARGAAVGPALREVYSSLGMPLPPNWNLAAFELRQWGANESAPSSAGAMTVRASLKNGAAFAQPMPLLRLELEDRFGGTVARRDFQPAEYLKVPAQASRLLPAGASTEAELEIVGTTSEAVGYRLDVCLRDENGVIRCAEPVATAPPSSQAPQ